MSSNDTIVIAISKGYTVIVDKCDSDLADYYWQARVASKNLVYAQRSIPNGEKRYTASMHRIIMSRIIGRELRRMEYIDHIDGNPLNNKRGNLRLCGAEGNNRNARIKCTNTSGYKGVCWSKTSHKWAASIHANGKRWHLGYYDTPELAYEAYKTAAIKYHGEFARF